VDCLAEKDSEFQSRQRRTEAVVDAATEPKVIGWVPSGEKGVCLGIVPVVAVRRAKEQQDAGAGGYVLRCDAYFVGGVAKEALDRCVVAHHLLNECRHQSRIVCERAPLVGLVDHGQRGVADRTRCGLVAGDEQQNAERNDLVVCNGIFARNEMTDDVRGIGWLGVCASRLDSGSEVIDEFSSVGVGRGPRRLVAAASSRDD
jgi:hypothetical protein